MKNLTWAATAICMLAACESLPNVEYSLIKEPNTELAKEVSSYALQETTVKIEKKNTDKGEKITITPGRRDHQDVRIALLGADDLGVRTDVSIVKFDNTDIPKEIVVKVEDHRKELIEKAGEIVVSGIKSGFVPFAVAGDIVLPATVNLSAALSTPKRDAHIVQFTDPNLSMKVDKAPIDAIEVSDLPNVGPGPYFYYGACRTATISFELGEEFFQETIKITDPNYLQRVRMPFDGKIEMHTQCGASVTGKLTGDASERNLDLINALLVQGKSIKEALDAAKQNK